MMKFHLLLLSTIYFLNVDAQPTAADWHFVESKIRRSQPEGVVYYADRLDHFAVDNLCPAIKKTTLVGNRQESIRLTAKEKNYIISALTKTYETALPDSLFANSKRVPREAIVDLVQRTNRRFSDSVLKLD